MDLATAGIALATTQICLSLLLLGTYFLFPDNRFSQLWAISGILGPIGISLILWNAGNDQVSCLLWGNSFLFGAIIIFWLGLEAFYEYNKAGWGIFYFLLYMYSYSMLLWHKAGVYARAYHFSICLIWVLGLSAKTLFLQINHKESERSRYPSILALGGIVILIATHAARATIIITKPEFIPAEYLEIINSSIAYIIPLSGTLLFFFGFFLIYLEQTKINFTKSIKIKNAELADSKATLEFFSHEYKTPLSIIKANLDLLLHIRTTELAPQKASIERMQRALSRLVELSNTAFNASSLQHSDTEHHWIPARTALLLTEVIEEVSQLWQEHHPSIEYELESDALILGDRNLLKAAFLNVLENAVKYSPPHSNFRIIHRSDQHQVIITIADNGPGIPESELILVSHKFFRGSKTRNVEGTGLGLYLVNRIIDQHNGKFTLSNRVGGGVIATITLPSFR